MDIGLIGCGRVSEIHINAYKNTPKANIIAARARRRTKRLRNNHTSIQKPDTFRFMTKMHAKKSNCSKASKNLMQKLL